MAARIKSGDEVIIVGGKDRGKKGKVLRVDPGKNRLYVEGLNIDRKSTRLNSSHLGISYAVFCLKKKNHFCTSSEGGARESPAPRSCSAPMGTPCADRLGT